MNDYMCVIFNQEQLGEGGAALPPAYLQLLQRSHVLDYDAANIPAYDDAPGLSGRLRAVAPLLNAPYLFDPDSSIALEDRPIDLLFVGSLNNARKHAISRVESCGLSVSYFDHPMYGPERDRYISQAKALLNIPFYESTRFEQTRVFNSLSIGTPVISLRRPGLVVDPAYESSVHWFEEADLEPYFCHQFKREQWFRLSREQLIRWRRNQACGEYEALARRLVQLAGSASTGFHQIELNSEASAHREPTPRLIKRLNLSPERGYRPDWLNVGTGRLNQSVDVDLDMESIASGAEHVLNLESGVRCVLRAGGLSEAYLYCQQGRLPSLHLLAKLTELLEEDGSLVLDMPIGVFSQGDQRLTLASTLAEVGVRLLHEDFHRFTNSDEIIDLRRFEQMEEFAYASGGTLFLLRSTFAKRRRTPRESVIVRMMRDDFGGLPQD